MIVDHIPKCQNGSGVLIAVHGGPTSVETIRLGIALADRWSGEAAILAVAPPGLTQVRRTAIERRLAEAVGDRRVPVYVTTGAIGPAIAQVAEAWGAALVVIGLGSRDHRTAAAIVRRARRCVLVVSPHQPSAIGRVILTADFGGSNVQADECALSLIDADAQTEIVHVVPDLYHLAPEKEPIWRRLYGSAAAELLAYTRGQLPHRTGHTIPTRALIGDAARVLVDIARQEHVDLIALGRHAVPATSGNDDFLGPVLESVLEQTPCSVLVAP